MKIIFGLGNPGRKYCQNRHNIGYLFVERFAREEKTKFTCKTNLRVALTEIKNYNEKIFLAKPTTFMNNSGLAVKKCKQYFNLPCENILIVYDDADLQLGKIRFRKKGSSGGHKGMLSVINSLGTENIPRLRIGIGKPIVGNDLVDFVLSDFSSEEIPLIHNALEEAIYLCKKWIRGEN